MYALSNAITMIGSTFALHRDYLLMNHVFKPDMVKNGVSVFYALNRKVK